MALSASLPMIVSYASGHIIPRLYEANGLGFSLGIGSLVCIFSLLIGLLLVVFDRNAERNDEQIKRNLSFLKEQELEIQGLNKSLDDESKTDEDD